MPEDLMNPGTVGLSVVGAGKLLPYVMKILKNSYAFASLTEVIVAAIVFSVAAVGILSTISFLKPQSTISAKRLEAAYFGKNILEQMRLQVDTNDWTLSGGDLDPAANPHLHTFGEYTATWNVTDQELQGTYPLLKKVQMSVTYPQ
jgi:hypothetical protein